MDLHSHLDHCYFKDDLDKVISNAKKAGLKIIVTSGINKQTNRKVLELRKKYDIVKCSMGIYPVSALDKEIETSDYAEMNNNFNIDEEIDFIKSNKDKIVMIGESGLDYFWIKDKNKEQKDLFLKIIKLAEETNKPLIVHSRKAELDCIELLESSKLKKIILHCFTGKKKLVIRAKNNGWYFTIPTSVVRSQQFQDMVKIVPLSHLFCESDSPYLSPFKSKRNEPSFVVESYKKIAEIKGLNIEEVAKNIFMNWQRVFN
jgi:TatD DNase family protein